MHLDSPQSAHTCSCCSAFRMSFTSTPLAPSAAAAALPPPTPPLAAAPNPTGAPNPAKPCAASGPSSSSSSEPPAALPPAPPTDPAVTRERLLRLPTSSKIGMGLRAVAAAAEDAPEVGLSGWGARRPAERAPEPGRAPGFTALQGQQTPATAGC
jgi:hypothetical protein